MIADLPSLIAIVELEFANAEKAIPDWDPHDYQRDYFAKQREAMTALAVTLETRAGAKIVERYDGARCRIAGISASSTGGIRQAVRNWLTAARKRAG